MMMMIWYVDLCQVADSVFITIPFVVIYSMSKYSFCCHCVAFVHMQWLSGHARSVLFLCKLLLFDLPIHLLKSILVP